MKIGIDISQIIYEGTGVAKYVRRLIKELLRLDKKNEYILFGASLRKRQVFLDYFNLIRGLNNRVRLITLPIPPLMLDLLWNKLHIVPVEWLMGSIDVFWSSDWTQPPLKKAIGMTTIHDLTVYKYPESFVAKIVSVQKRRLTRVKRECQFFLCDSQTTRQDVQKILKIPEKKLSVIYPGLD